MLERCKLWLHEQAEEIVNTSQSYNRHGVPLVFWQLKPYRWLLVSILYFRRIPVPAYFLSVNEHQTLLHGVS